MALLGPNGSGKSTLVRGVLGLVERQGGEVLLLGTPIERFHEHTRIGYVPQRHSLSASVRATVTEIVAVGRLPTARGGDRRSRGPRGRGRRAIEDVGLADRADEEVASLSGGQQRRVLIARALAGRPEVLVMDEPTAGSTTRARGRSPWCCAASSAAARSMLVVTHELAALEDVVTRIVCMDAGHVDFDGTAAAYAATSPAHAPGAATTTRTTRRPVRGHVIGAAPARPGPAEVAP